MDPSFGRPQTARAQTARACTPRSMHVPPPPPQPRPSSAAPRGTTRALAYAEPPAWARQSWGGRSSVASSPRKVGSRDLGCFDDVSWPTSYSKETSVSSTPASSPRDAGVRLDVKQLLAAAAAAAAGHEPAAVRQAQAKLAGKLLLSEQETAMLRDVASPRVAASRLEPRYQRNAAAAAAAAADQEAAVRLVQLKLAEGQMLTEREMALLREAAEADTSLQQLSIEAPSSIAQPAAHRASPDPGPGPDPSPSPSSSLSPGPELKPDPNPTGGQPAADPGRHAHRQCAPAAAAAHAASAALERR